MLKLAAFFRHWMARLTPHVETRAAIARAFNWAAWVMLALLISIVWSQGPSVYSALGLLLSAGLLLLLVVLVYLAIGLISRISSQMRWGLLFVLAVVIMPYAGLGAVAIALMLSFVVAVALIAAGWTHKKRKGSHWATWTPLASGVGLLLAWIGFLGVSGWQVGDEDVWQPMQDVPLSVADPSQRGVFDYTTFTYGPGSEQRRQQFGDQVRFKTDPVDGSKLLDGWEGLAGWARSKYWGAEPDALPLRGQVWMPTGSGPFPIVLIVHGNHAMEDYSDDGYAYLGEHFASRGYVTVSVDQNFFNSSTADLLSLFDGGLEEENDARGWLLLEHLSLWRDWNNDVTHPLAGRIDLQRVVLIGHSRGGEAVSEAAVFNQLPAYPNDVTLAFDYDFGLAGVIAIAPVDNQYNPRGRDTQIRDVNYLVIHGSHDSDVDAFVGSATYNRVVFPTCSTCFKSSHYLIGANHGQFNTSWGLHDAPAPFSYFLNTDTMIDPMHQRQVAVGLFTAYLEAVVRNNPAYQAFLAAPHRAKWLPVGTRMMSNYLHAGDQVLASFEEDANAMSASHADVRIEGQGLSLWKEQEVELKWSETDSAMVLLGWHEDSKDSESAPAAYRLSISNGLEVRPNQALAFSMAMSVQAPGEIDDYEPPETIDLSVILEDANGEQSRVLLSKRRPLLPQVDAVMYKLRGMNSDAGPEVVLQRYRFGFEEFLKANPKLDLQAVSSVQFVFDQSSHGSLWLDDINISNSGM